MGVEIRKKGNCIGQYNTLEEKEHIKVINNPCKSKRAFTELRRGSGVSFGVYWCELWTETRSVIFVSRAVNCHYACGSTKVTVRSIQVVYRYSPSVPTVYNYHTSALIVPILTLNVIALQHKKRQTPKPSLPLYSYIKACSRKWS